LNIFNTLGDNFYGDTLLIWAAYHGHVKVVVALLQYLKTDPNIQDNRGETALTCASRFGHNEVVATLLQHPQTNPNLQDKNGKTALMFAAFYKRYKIVSILLEHPQTNPSIKNDDGYTALVLASKRGYVGVVSIIQDHLKSRSIATINKSICGLYEAIHGRNPVMFFNQPVPKDIIIEIAKLTGDYNVHTDSQSREISTAGYKRISPQALFSSPPKHSQAQQPPEQPQEELFNSESWCSIL